MILVRKILSNDPRPSNILSMFSTFLLAQRIRILTTQKSLPRVPGKTSFCRSSGRFPLTGMRMIIFTHETRSRTGIKLGSSTGVPARQASFSRRGRTGGGMQEACQDQHTHR